MTEPALQDRLGTVLLLLVANFLLLAGIGRRPSAENAVGVLVLVLLIAYRHYGDGDSFDQS